VSRLCSAGSAAMRVTRVTNGIPLGCSLLLPVSTVNCVQTLKGRKDFVAAKLLAVEAVWQLAHARSSLTDLAFVREAIRVRCTVFDRSLHSRIPLVPTPLLRFKLEHACDPIMKFVGPVYRYIYVTSADTITCLVGWSPSYRLMLYSNHELCHHTDLTG
jgi:hypothetical protein